MSRKQITDEPLVRETFWCPRKDCVNVYLRMSRVTVIMRPSSFLFFFLLLSACQMTLFFGKFGWNSDTKKNKLYKIKYDPSRSLFWKIVNQKSCLKKKESNFSKSAKGLCNKKKNKRNFRETF